MKKLLTIALLLCITTIANSQIIRADLTVTGLTCSMCSKATYNQLISIPANMTNQYPSYVGNKKIFTT